MMNTVLNVLIVLLLFLAACSACDGDVDLKRTDAVGIACRLTDVGGVRCVVCNGFSRPAVSCEWPAR